MPRHLGTRALCGLGCGRTGRRSRAEAPPRSPDPRISPQACSWTSVLYTRAGVCVCASPPMEAQPRDSDGLGMNVPRASPEKEPAHVVIAPARRVFCALVTWRAPAALVRGHTQDNRCGLVRVVGAGSGPALLQRVDTSAMRLGDKWGIDILDIQGSWQRKRMPMALGGNSESPAAAISASELRSLVDRRLFRQIRYTVWCNSQQRDRRLPPYITSNDVSTRGAASGFEQGSFL
jgi:hypothetical protein